MNLPKPPISLNLIDFIADAKALLWVRYGMPESVWDASDVEVIGYLNDKVPGGWIKVLSEHDAITEL